MLGIRWWVITPSTPPLLFFSSRRRHTRFALVSWARDVYKRQVWKPAKDTQIPRRRTRRHQSRASAWAAGRRDPCPIVDGHHGHHGHPSVKTLKKFLAARWGVGRRDDAIRVRSSMATMATMATPRARLSKKILELGGWGVLTSGHSPWIFFLQLYSKGVAKVAMVATGQPSSGSSL